MFVHPLRSQTSCSCALRCEEFSDGMALLVCGGGCGLTVVVCSIACFLYIFVVHLNEL